MLYIPFPFKRCSKCSDYLPFIQFGIKRNKPDGMRPSCKSCHKRDTHYDPAHRKEYFAQYRKEHREERAMYNQKYIKRTKDTPLGIARRARRAVYYKEYHLKHRNKKIAIAQKYYKTHKADKREYDRRYAKERTFNEIARRMKLASWHRYKARKLALPHEFNGNDWTVCLQWWNDKCAYCSVPLEKSGPAEANMDHFIALDDPRCPGTIIGNIVPACKSCNCSKNNTDPVKWIQAKFTPTQSEFILNRIKTYFTAIRKT